LTAGEIDPAVTAMTPPIGSAEPRRRGRLVAWVVLVVLLAAASYGSRLADAELPDDVLYRWSTFVGALIQYGIMLVLVLAIARGFNRPLLALDAPARRGRAVVLAVVALVVIVGTTAALSPFLDAGEEQGLVPDAWDSSRAAPFLANAAVVVLVAPFVEELLFRGLGIGLLLPYVGAVPAIIVTGVAFGLAHGLVLGLPVLSIFGFTLGWLRWRTGSVYPGMAVHALFNAAALIAAVTL
jgi:membrane protease YdiL (CAAX protease family)